MTINGGRNNFDYFKIIITRSSTQTYGELGNGECQNINVIGGVYFDGEYD